MKTYEVYIINDIITVRADGAKAFCIDDKVTDISFYRGDEIIAQFYANNICGWSEVEDGLEGE